MFSQAIHTIKNLVKLYYLLSQLSILERFLIKKWFFLNLRDVKMWKYSKELKLGSAMADIPISDTYIDFKNNTDFSVTLVKIGASIDN